MDFVKKEIERALEKGFYYLAFIGAITIPDICAALESKGGETSREKYRNWCDAWLMDLYPHLTSSDVYDMRCGVLHQGRSRHRIMQYSRIIFTFPNQNGNIFHDNVINDALNLDIETFCRDLIDSEMRWYSKNKNNTFVIANLPKVIKYYPDGMAPYIIGVPIIS